MGTATYPITFGRTDLPADLTDYALPHGHAGDACGAVLPYPGDIVALSVSGSPEPAAGSATFEVAINGVKIPTPIAVINAVNTQRALTTIGHEAKATFKAGDRVDVLVTTTADWDPTTTDFAIELWCTLGSYAPG